MKNTKLTALFPSIEDEKRHPGDPKRPPGQCRQWLALSATQRQSEPEALGAHLVFGGLVARGSGCDAYGFADVAILVAPGVSHDEALGAARRLVAELESIGAELLGALERHSLPVREPTRFDWDSARRTIERGERMLSRVVTGPSE